MVQIQNVKPKPWRLKVDQFISAYETAKTSNPKISLEDFAKTLNVHLATAYRMLAISRHLDDIRISNSVSFRQAYSKTKTYYQTSTETLAEITSIVNSFGKISNQIPPTKCGHCNREFKNGDTCSFGSCPMGGDF